MESPRAPTLREVVEGVADPTNQRTLEQHRMLARGALEANPEDVADRVYRREAIAHWRNLGELLAAIEAMPATVAPEVDHALEVRQLAARICADPLRHLEPTPTEQLNLGGNAIGEPIMGDHDGK